MSLRRVEVTIDQKWKYAVFFDGEAATQVTLLGRVGRKEHWTAIWIGGSYVPEMAKTAIEAARQQRVNPMSGIK